MNKGGKGEVPAERLSAPNKRPQIPELIMLMNQKKGHRGTTQGKPCEGKPHARFDEGSRETS
jgi:hypothetical protein